MEVFIWRCSKEKVFSKSSKNLEENTSFGVFFSNISNSTNYLKYLQTAASENSHYLLKIPHDGSFHVLSMENWS